MRMLGQNNNSGEVHPWAYLPSGERINLYADPTAFCIALGIQPSGQVTVRQAKLAVHQMLGSMARANSSSSAMTVGSSFGVTDENAPPSQRNVRFTMTHIEPALRYASATGDMSPLEGYTDIVVGPDGRPAIEASQGYGVTGTTRGFGALKAAKEETHQRDAIMQAAAREIAATNGTVIER